MKVAMVGQGNYPIPWDGYAPVEKHISSLADALRARGVDVLIVNRVLPRFRGRLLVHAAWADMRIRGWKPDIVHCHSPINAVVMAALGTGPLIFTSHSREWQRYARLGMVSRELRLHRRAWRKSDVRIALSESMLSAIHQDANLSELPAHVVPNGVDTDWFHSPATPRTGHLLAGIGIIAPVKRWHLLAEAMTGTPWRLELVGPLRDGPYARWLETYPNVRLHGELPAAQVREVLHRARVYVHPSEAEAMSLAVLEAMATGLPVLGSAMVRENVEPCGGGIVVPERAESEMVRMYRDALMTVPLRQWDGMGAAAARHVRTQFTWQGVAQRLTRVYARALETHSAA